MLKLFSKSDSTYDATIIIRSVKERTEPICYHLLSRQISPKNIHIVHQNPFSKALKRSFEVGLKANRKWTIVVDADVLVRTNILEELISRAEKAPESVFAIQSEMLDKFFGGVRVGGIKLYRTSLLPQAIDLVPSVDVRPETYVIKNMHKKGYYVDISKLICGIHDFEQYYSDIFRKGFSHGVKHSSLMRVLLPYWGRMSSSDQDFKILLAGFDLAKEYEGNLLLDKNEVRLQYNEYLDLNHLKEKKHLSKTAFTSEIVDKLLARHVDPPEYRAVKKEIDKKGRPTIPFAAK